MASERRILRLQQLILEVVAETLQREGRNPRLALVSFTRVKLSQDLSKATVSWSCLGTDKGRSKTTTALEGVLPTLRRRVAKAMATRVTPRLELLFDPTLERAQRLETIFHHLAEERGEDEDADEEAVEEHGGESAPERHGP